VTPHDIARDTGARLQEADARGLNATLAWSQPQLDTEAARLDEMQATAPLFGMPVAIKDNIVTTDLPTTCASRILEGYRSPFEATAVERLRAAGAIIACKTNLDEFAMGSSTENSAFGRVKNPIDLDRVPGGSSGGSAALVAAGVVPAALGSETGGSVRQPASFCGVVGVKPTYGRVSRYGLVAFGSSLDCISVFGRTVSDAARVLGTISGHDSRDATSAPRPALSGAVPHLGDLKGLRVGLPREYFPADLDAGVRAALDRTAATLKAHGATLTEVALPHTKYAVPTYYIIAPAEAASNLARYDGVRYGLRKLEHGDGVGAMYQQTRGAGFGPEVRRRILVGTYVLSAGYYDAYYRKAQAVRALIAGDFARAFGGGLDLLLTPTTPTPAFRAGDKVSDPVAMYYSDVFVCGISLAGLPALSVPVGRSEGLPIGAQLIAPMFEEDRMLGVAQLLERAIDGAAEVR
jgi:aspartyl-tRNA(Asn)/glutamyl-tRNA(Gln) amidotransferase subunit A